jgi:hypothetical protein
MATDLQHKQASRLPPSIMNGFTIGTESKPRLLPKKRLEEMNRVSKEERKEAEQDNFDKIPKKVLHNGMVQRMVERVHEIQDAEREL